MTGSPSEAPMRQTPLHDLHVALGAKMVGFAGWALPVQYPDGVLAEHGQCRDSAVLFDVSHMGQVILRGEGAAAALEALAPGDFQALKPGKARYTVFTNGTGGILDDLIVSNAGDHLYVVINAACREADLNHMRANLPGTVTVEEVTNRALVALQGPLAVQALAALAPGCADLSFMETVEMNVAGAPCRVSRLGYTGEDGFEISIPETEAPGVANALLAREEVSPAGLGARDSLRLEAGLCLYGSDIDQSTSPVEAGLRWIIGKRRREEGGFPGAERILGELRDGPARKLVGILPEGRAPARAGVVVLGPGDAPIGAVTSGGFGPSVGGPVSMGYVEADFAAPETPIGLDVRGKRREAKVVSLPFAPHRYKR